MMLCDFHIHSHFSDGRLSIPELVDLYGKRGFGAIAITDHLCEEHTFLGHTARFFERTLTRATFPKYLATIREEAERAWKQYRMLVIPGYELTKNSLLHNRSAHIVVLGAETWLSADQEVPALAKQVRELGAVSIAAHPVSTGKLEPQTFYLWDRRREFAESFDAWEVASGKVIFEEVRASGLPLIANSDLHHPRQMSSWKTKLHCERHQGAIFDAIRKQQLDFAYFEDRVPLFGFACDSLEKTTA